MSKDTLKYIEVTIETLISTSAITPEEKNELLEMIEKRKQILKEESKFLEELISIDANMEGYIPPTFDDDQVFLKGKSNTPRNDLEIEPFSPFTKETIKKQEDDDLSFQPSSKPKILLSKLDITNKKNSQTLLSEIQTKFKKKLSDFSNQVKIESKLISKDLKGFTLPQNSSSKYDPSKTTVNQSQGKSRFSSNYQKYIKESIIEDQDDFEQAPNLEVVKYFELIETFEKEKNKTFEEIVEKVKWHFKGSKLYVSDEIIEQIKQEKTKKQKSSKAISFEEIDEDIEEEKDVLKIPSESKLLIAFRKVEESSNDPIPLNSIKKEVNERFKKIGHQVPNDLFEKVVEMRRKECLKHFESGSKEKLIFFKEAMDEAKEKLRKKIEEVKQDEEEVVDIKKASKKMVYIAFKKIEKSGSEPKSLNDIRKELTKLLAKSNYRLDGTIFDEVSKEREKECLEYLESGSTEMERFYKEAMEKGLKKSFKNPPTPTAPKFDMMYDVESKKDLIDDLDDEFLFGSFDSKDTKEKSKDSSSGSKKTSIIDHDDISFESIVVKKSPDQEKCIFESTKGFCRFTNLISQKDQCKYSHSYKVIDYQFKKELVSKVIFDEESKKFTDSFGGSVQVVSIHRIINKDLQNIFETIKGHIKGEVLNLYHGTSMSIMDNICKSGFKCPSNYEVDPKCKVSGHLGSGKLSFCDNRCKLCTKNPHQWTQGGNFGCHMYGLGIYFATVSSKSNRYVVQSGTNKKMFVCKVVLGNSYYLDRDLTQQDELHDWILPPKGCDSIFVKGRKGAKSGLGVINDEVIIFNPFQALPFYEIEYK